MAQLHLLFAALGWLALGHAQEHAQHILADPGSESADFIRDKLKDANIIPDVIADFPPSLGLHVTWPGTGWPRLDRALLGNTLDPRRLHGQPAIGLHDISAASPSSSSAVSYVITLTDADASPHASHPHFHEDGGKKKGEYCHWIASGTLRPSLCDPKEPGPCPPVLVDVEEVFKYKGPAPKKGTGKHRYVFLAFVPSNGTTEKLHLSKPKGRRGWGADHGVEGWAGENGLAAVGANFIYARHH